MKIGFDAKRAVQNNTGLGNYSRYILEILGRYQPENDYLLYAPKPKDNPRLQKVLQALPLLQMCYPKGWLQRKLSALWRVWGVTQQAEADGVQIFHGLSNELPLNIGKSKMKSIVTIHDLIFLRYPQYYKPIDRAIYTYKFRKACEQANCVLAISECTKRDVMYYFHIPESKIEVIYQGCDPQFALPASTQLKDEVRCKYQLPERFILNVGSIEERKNVLLAVKALEAVPDDVALVIIGGHTPYTDLVERYAQEHGLQQRVRILHGIPFTELVAFYQLATVFVYPSRFEGFGIPIIEALNAGVPVIAATGSCLEEAGGPDSIYVHPDDVQAMQGALLSLLNDPALRAQMIEAGKVYAKRFDEKKQAHDIDALYRRLAVRNEPLTKS